LVSNLESTEDTTIGYSRSERDISGSDLGYVLSLIHILGSDLGYVLSLIHKTNPK